MLPNKKIILLTTQVLLIPLLSSCQVTDGPVRIVFPPEPAPGKPADSVSARFQEPAPKGPTAVESAVELSQKYAKLSEQYNSLRQQKNQLDTQNRTLSEQVTDLEAKLQQTQKELNDANDLLIEMRIELNNWKTDILGFRDEMRDAEKEQLKALIRILTVLGGEIEPQSEMTQTLSQNDNTPTNIAQQHKNQNPGEYNE
jgi:chromosome segregation ATPase